MTAGVIPKSRDGQHNKRNGDESNHQPVLILVLPKLLR
jgi:hypothetical protein